MALIEVRGLTKLYRMGDSVVHALDGVDLTIERGEFVAITGASGSGKSTMMHVLGCLDRPTGGTYVFDGRTVDDLSDRELAATRNRQIGFVFQTFNLINRTTAEENVGVPLFYARRTNTRGPALRALQRVGLSQRARHQPSELSGGERQRVAIARAIVNDPLLLLADEPTGNLDTRTGRQIMDIFRALNEQGVTIVVVTHETEIARGARRVAHMRDGKIVSDRLTADILAEEGRVARGEVTPAEEPEPIPASEPTAGYAPGALTARMVEGARRALGCGLAAVILWAVAVGTQGLLTLNYDLKALNPTKPVPTLLIVGGLVAATASLVALILGVLAIVFGRGARKRIRLEPGNWLGGRRALAGLVLGWSAVALPVVVLAVSIIKVAIYGADGGWLRQ